MTVNQGRGPRRIAVADAVEVAWRAGMVLIRAGRLLAGHRPVDIVVPALMLGGWLDDLYDAVLLAEEDYWPIVAAVLRAANEPDNVHAAREYMVTWLLDQNWTGLIHHVPAAAGSPCVVTSAGHVCLVLDPPLVTEPFGVVLDPLQMHRMRPRLITAAVAAALQPSVGESLEECLAEAHAYVAALPWPAATPTPLSAEQVEAELRAARVAFLAREPHRSPRAHGIEPPGR